MDQSTIVLLGLLGLVVGIVVMLVISVLLASRGNAEAAEINRKENKPVSNGFAIAAGATVIIIFVIVLLTGFLPPLLRRG